MALSVLRLRRAVSPLSATLIKHRVYSRAPIICSITDQPNTQVNPSRRPHQLTPLLGFRSSAPLSDRRFDSGDNKISPDEILFEGCDYNHWLITMDFPDDPKPTPEQMVETYVETLAKVVGSREEAMKRMYACSTTTYTGFQAVMTEEMSEKFRGLPGVVFILPDSYIDPVNKEYGGDKYEMGKITPRPPPVQYGRQGRYNDRNRNYDRPRYDRPQVQGNRQFDNQGGFNQGDGRNYAPPQQNYNPMGQQGISMNDTHGSTQGQGSPYRPPAGYNPGQQGNQPYNPQGSAPGNPRSYPPQNNYPQGNLGFPPSTGGMDYGPRSGQYGSRPQNPIPSYQPQGGFVQGRESQMGNDGPAAGGIHRQSPGYNYEQQYPGSEGYTGYNNAMNHGKN